MAHSGSAEKRIRQNEKRRVRNRMTRSQIRTASRTFLNAVEAKETENAEKAYAEVEKLLDTAAGKGVYHKNNVARKKSRLYKKLAALKA